MDSNHLSSSRETLRVWVAPVAKIYGIEAIENTTNFASALFDCDTISGNNRAS